MKPSWGFYVWAQGQERDTAVWACNSESNSKLTSGNHVSLGLLSSALSSFVNIVMKMVVLHILKFPHQEVW
jgi:hypothetical protein